MALEKKFKKHPEVMGFPENYLLSQALQCQYTEFTISLTCLRQCLIMQPWLALNPLRGSSWPQIHKDLTPSARLKVCNAKSGLDTEGLWKSLSLKGGP